MQNNEVGYYYGVLDVYYALMSTADGPTAVPTYSDPKILGKSIEVTLTPRYREGSLYASNRKVRRAKRMDGYDVKLNVDQVASDVRIDLTGRHVDKNGVQVIDGDSDSSTVAIGFAITKDNGAKEMWWLYSGIFWENEVAIKTDADKIEYQTPTIEGTFDRRIFDNRLGVVVDTDDDAVPADVIKGWFDAVYESPADTPAA